MIVAGVTIAGDFDIHRRLPGGRGRLASLDGFLRRANELLHSVCPLRGSLTRTVWNDLGGYRGLPGAARTVLAEQDDSPAPPVVQRVAYQLAVAWARQPG